ncbi:hypothetical protein EDB85DRAFT_149181 [Lactarius pseudohatsudake]|nr:hypothetical protein EDB85DRAFT_149181 [Lactarius pseudohatsudake]
MTLLPTSTSLPIHFLQKQNKSDEGSTSLHSYLTPTLVAPCLICPPRQPTKMYVAIRPSLTSIRGTAHCAPFSARSFLSSPSASFSWRLRLESRRCTTENHTTFIGLAHRASVRGDAIHGDAECTRGTIKKHDPSKEEIDSYTTTGNYTIC